MIYCRNVITWMYVLLRKVVTWICNIFVQSVLWMGENMLDGVENWISFLVFWVSLVARAP